MSEMNKYGKALMSFVNAMLEKQRKDAEARRAKNAAIGSEEKIVRSRETVSTHFKGNSSAAKPTDWFEAYMIATRLTEEQAMNEVRTLVQSGALVGNPLANGTGISLELPGREKKVVTSPTAAKKKAVQSELLALFNKQFGSEFASETTEAAAS